MVSRSLMRTKRRNLHQRGCLGPELSKIHLDPSFWILSLYETLHNILTWLSSRGHLSAIVLESLLQRLSCIFQIFHSSFPEFLDVGKRHPTKNFHTALAKWK